MTVSVYFAEFEKPLFKQGMTSLEDLKPGEVVTGRVENVTHFGAFVDIGVGCSGLLHNSKMPSHLLSGKKSLELGSRVQVEVFSVDKQSKKIGLKLLRLL